jgi:uncharacterized protein YbjT (DUF2867 family)
VKPVVLLAGASGLTGRHVLAQLQEAELHILVRKHLDGVSPDIIQHISDPAEWPGIIGGLKLDVAISCLGTTWKKSGRNASVFRAVDHDLVLAVAAASKAAGAGHFISISSVGASSGASGLYLRTKGETEDALAKMGFDRLDILRPGLLLGERSNDPRLAERLGMIISPLTDMLTPRRYSKFRAISAQTVARAIKQLVQETSAGRFINENDAIHALAG